MIAPQLLEYARYHKVIVTEAPTHMHVHCVVSFLTVVSIVTALFVHCYCLHIFNVPVGHDIKSRMLL